jgi:hypothetical protein
VNQMRLAWIAAQQAGRLFVPPKKYCLGRLLL